MSCGTTGFISDQLGLARKTHFQNDPRYSGVSIYGILSKYINDQNNATGLAESIGVTIPIAQFSNFLQQILLNPTNYAPASGLRVYFASTLIKYLPKDPKDTLTLVFSPTVDPINNNNRGDYYVYQISTSTIIPILRNEAIDLINDFQQGKMSTLQNLEKGQYDPSFKETQSICYKIEYLQNWKCNAMNPGSGNPIVTNIRFTFGAYLNTGETTVNKYDVKNQLSLQIDFLNGNDLVHLEFLKGVDVDLIGDTGVPCPPPPPPSTTCPGA